MFSCRDDSVIYFLRDNKSLLNKWSANKRFSYFLSRMTNTPYSLGHESYSLSDCSGSVCLSLMLATGEAVRTTSDCLLRTFFTLPYDREKISAAFFTCRKDFTDAGRSYHKGECVHCAGVCGNGVVLNCAPPSSYLISLNTMIKNYDALGYDCVIKSLDLKAFKAYALKAGGDKGLDDEFNVLHRFLKEGFYGL